jgi:hypothetical protein
MFGKRRAKPMAERSSQRVHPESAVLDIGQDTGALIIYTREELRGQEIEVSPRGNDWRRVHTEVLERRVQDRPVFAALFAALTAGEYKIWAPDPSLVDQVTIVGGQVAEVDWR